MKNYWKKLLVLVLIIPCIILFTACSNGASAYEIWLRNGNSGTEADFLRSLRGNDGSDGNDTDALMSVIIQEYERQKAVDPNFNEDLLTFISKYFRGPEGNSTGSSDIAAAANIAVRSAVSIRATIYDHWKVGYGQGGSGVIYELGYNGGIKNGDAYIITNYHVISKYCSVGYENYREVRGLKVASEVTVYLYGLVYTETAIPAVVLGGSYEYDIAVLRVTGSQVIVDNPVRAVKEEGLSGRNEPVLGATVMAVGNPLGNGTSVTEGVVSVQSEYLTMTALDNSGTARFRVLRTSAAINPGNSGGGLFDSNANLVGIVQARTFETSGTDPLPVESMSYAIPLDIALRVTNQIIARRAEYRWDDVKREYISVPFIKPVLGMTTETGNPCYKVALNHPIYRDGEVYIQEDVVFDSIRTQTGIDELNKNSSGVELFKVQYASGSAQFVNKDVLKSVSWRVGGTLKFDNNLSRLYQLSDCMLDCYESGTLTFKVQRGGNIIDVSFTITRR